MNTRIMSQYDKDVFETLREIVGRGKKGKERYERRQRLSYERLQLYGEIQRAIAE